METSSSRETKTGATAVIEINVGGKVFTTSRLTLCSDRDSMLATLFDVNSPFKILKDSTGRPFLDRDGDAFALVLDFLRRGQRLV